MTVPGWIAAIPPWASVVNEIDQGLTLEPFADADGSVGLKLDVEPTIQDCRRCAGACPRGWTGSSMQATRALGTWAVDCASSTRHALCAVDVPFAGVIASSRLRGSHAERRPAIF